MHLYERDRIEKGSEVATGHCRLASVCISLPGPFHSSCCIHCSAHRIQCSPPPTFVPPHPTPHPPTSQTIYPLSKRAKHWFKGSSRARFRIDVDASIHPFRYTLHTCRRKVNTIDIDIGCDSMCVVHGRRFISFPCQPSMLACLCSQFVLADGSLRAHCYCEASETLRACPSNFEIGGTGTWFRESVDLFLTSSLFVCCSLMLLVRACSLQCRFSMLPIVRCRPLWLRPVEECSSDATPGNTSAMSSDVAALQEQRRLVQEESKRLTCLLIESREQQRYWSRKAAEDKAWRRGVGLCILAITPDDTAALQQ